MHYFIDGYNLLFRTVDSEDELQKQRDDLLQDLKIKIKLIDLDATIVFDAAFSPGGVSRSRGGDAEVVFTAAGESADSFVLDELRHIAEPQKETLVTSDKLLAWRARRLGAHTVDIETFVVWLESRYRNKLRKQGTKMRPPRQDSPAVRVVSPSPQERPEAHGSPEACFDYYVHTFQKRLDELPPEPVAMEYKPAGSLPQMKKKLKKKPKEQEPNLSDETRYLRLFSERLDELEGKKSS